MVAFRRLSAQEISTALGGKPAGEDKWKACCPAHDDKNPSLSIAESASGKVLLKCWSGCTQEQVIRALQDRRLWPDFEEEPVSRIAHTVSVDPEFDALLSRVYWFLLRDQLVDTEMRELERVLIDAELVEPDSGYIVVGQILEDAARNSYQTVVRAAAELRCKGLVVARHVDRWMNERYPDALFEPRR